MNSPGFSRSPIKVKLPGKLQILFAVTLGALCIMTLPAFGQTGNTNFSGRWELDRGRSDFGSGPAPKDIFVQINQEGKTVVVMTTFVTPNGEIKRVQKLRTDGALTTNYDNGRELTSTTHWQDHSLVTIIRDPRGAEVTETRALGENGKVMTVTITSSLNNAKLVMLKK